MKLGKDWLERVIEQELFDTLCGELIGSGVSREVYECIIDPTLVVKIEDVSDSDRQNIFEWETWREVKETTYAKWFTPCVSLTAYGGILLQKRTKKPSKKSIYPKRMPAFLGDFKYTNYGMYKGRLRVHDYGRNLLMLEGLTGKMRKVDWWDDIDSGS